MTGVQRGEVFGLCVVSTWDTDTGPQYGEVTLAWAATRPMEGGDPADGRVPKGAKDDNTQKTTAIDWYIALESGFKYDVGTVSASINDDSELSCSSVSNVTEEEGDGSQRYRPTAAVKAYTKYAACVRAKNGSGESDWAALPTYYALPGKLTRAPTYESGDSVTGPYAATNITGTGVTGDPYVLPAQTINLTDVVWSFKGGPSLPDNHGRYEARVLGWAGTGKGVAPDSEKCGTVTGGNDYVVVADSGISIEETGSGFEVKAVSISAVAAIGPTFSTKTVDDTKVHTITSQGSYYLYACVQAKLADEETSEEDRAAEGPWSSVGSKTIKIPNN